MPCKFIFYTNMSTFFLLTSIFSALIVVLRTASVLYVHSGLLQDAGLWILIKTIFPLISADILFFILAYGIAFTLLFFVQKKGLLVALVLFLWLWIRYLIDTCVTFFTLNRVTFFEGIGFVSTLPIRFDYLIGWLFLLLSVFGWYVYRRSIASVPFVLSDKKVYLFVLMWWFFCLSYVLSQKLIDTTYVIAPHFIQSPLFFDIKHYNTKSPALSSDTQWYPEKYEERYTPTSWLNKDPNIIVLFLESFSAVDSMYIGAIDDRIPKTDIIQSEGLAFGNFISNGCTSDASHIALLYGIEPWMHGDMWSTSLYDAYVWYTEPLPLFAKKMWYSTAFYSTVSLDFLWQYKFINRLWFDKVIWEDAFSWFDTYTFGAAADEHLYNRMLADIDNNPNKKMFIGQTISTHIPFSSPYGDTQEDVYRYADDALRAFYSWLQERDFFDNGILIIVWDHRKMSPVTNEEIVQRWRSAQWRIVGAVVWTGITPGLWPSMIQHNDIHYSIKQLIADTDFLSPPFWSSIWDESIRRDVSVRYCGYVERDYVVTLDDSRQIDTEQVMQKLYAYIQSFELFQQWNTSGSINTWVSFIVDQQLSETPIHHALDGVTLIGHWWLPATDPYNSIAGFIRAIYAWADAVELDVSFTKDGYPIVAHGPGLRSPECREVPIHTLSWDYIQKNCFLSNGEFFKDLRSVLEETADIVPSYIVELKFVLGQDSVALTKKLLATIEDLSMLDTVTFITYDDKSRDYLASYSTVGLWWDTFDPDDLSAFAQQAVRDRYRYFMLPHDRWTSSMIEQAEDRWVAIMTYTPKTEQELTDAYNIWLRSFMVDDIAWAKDVLEDVVN